MKKNSYTLVLVILVMVLSAGIAHAKRASLLREDFALGGVDGRLKTLDKGKRWFFELDSQISDGKAILPPGTSMEIMPSAGLEKMVDDAAKHTDANYRLWGRVTKYNDKNFIFPIYFLPLNKVKPIDDSKPATSEQKKAPAINEPNDPLAIPADVIAKLEKRPVVRTEQLRKGLELEQDSILADRTGFIKKDDKGKTVFVLDAVGRGIENISFGLLPSQSLERAEQKQASELEQIRFKTAGVVTKYKGSYYLLLQRATKVYSHGNFPK